LAKTSGFVHSAAELGKLAIDQKDGSVVRLADVADVSLRPAEPKSYVYYGDKQGPLNPAVTISLSKRKGANAIDVAHAALQMVETLRGSLIPNTVKVAVTRNYGETAAEKSDELLEHMLIAVFGVTILVALALGRRESAVVLIAIPVTLALTLLIFKLYGYTLNRITLFALIFSIGILVDDAIVVVENMVRHFRFPVHLRRPLHEAAVYAVDEVGNPTILATFTVIAAILPMAFVGGLMGPYMRPIPVGASAAMVFSLLVAFIITPWAALRLLRKEAGHHRQEQGEPDTAATLLYRRVMDRLIHSSNHRLAFFVLMALLLLGAVSFLPLKWVTVKMLPFDNKNEFQIIVDMPEGSPLEKTFAATAAIVNQVRSIPEVTDYIIYAGTSGPYNFNGLVRHYFLRNGSNVADIQVNLVGKGERKRQSHEIARSVRQDIQRIARRFGANVKIAEVPPGPPVLQTLVAEVYGQDHYQQVQLARRIKDIFQRTDGVVDVDWYVEDPQPTVRFEIDQARARLAGIQTQQAAETLRNAISATSAGNAHIEDAKEEIPIVLRFPKSARAWEDQIAQVKLENAAGQLVPLATITQAKTEASELSIYHKNLRPVVYVTADVAGREESPVYAILKLNKELSRLPTPAGATMQIYSTKQPFSPSEYAVKWDGEWHITYEVFRDLGIAFAAVMALIYLLVVGWFQSFRTPLVIMAPIPLTLVGILPAHAMLGAYFTATSMIGFIAGAGIIVRNSIILVDFVELRRKQGMPLDQAVIDAGALRFRPMLLTAAAVMVGSSVILFDPIFQGLAVSLLAGEVASTLLSRLAVPVLYYLSEKRAEKHAEMRPSRAIASPQ
jgi:multidrug efflux pump subunit AcrB